MAELLPLLTKYGFEVVNTEDMVLPGQLDRTFSLCVPPDWGLHGAGNTNIIFADNSLRFLDDRAIEQALVSVLLAFACSENKIL
jgi:hypothetical protein